MGNSIEHTYSINLGLRTTTPFDWDDIRNNTVADLAYVCRLIDPNYPLPQKKSTLIEAITEHLKGKPQLPREQQPNERAFEFFTRSNVIANAPKRREVSHIHPKEEHPIHNKEEPQTKSFEVHSVVQEKVPVHTETTQKAQQKEQKVITKIPNTIIKKSDGFATIFRRLSGVSSSTAPQITLTFRVVFLLLHLVLLISFWLKM